MVNQKQLQGKMLIYIPQTKTDQKPVEQLIKLGKKDRGGTPVCELP